MQRAISITSIASLSPLGFTAPSVWESYTSKRPLFKQCSFSNRKEWVAPLAKDAESHVAEVRESNHSYKHLDQSVLMAIAAARKVYSEKVFRDSRAGVNIGSSRGATHILETYHEEFLNTGRVSPFASPTTTLGNLSSWVAQDLGTKGIGIDQSVTCSTALHALLNGMAWLQSDMADVFIVGGSEAALTPFTLAQMRAMKLYSDVVHHRPCESMRFQKKKNTMVLGEGAAVAVLEKGVSDRSLAIIQGYGLSTEQVAHPGAISSDGECFQRSMRMALDMAGLDTVDVIVMHAPGTVKGDMAEFEAIKREFSTGLPLLTGNKWQIGHTFAASGMLSIEMGIRMMQHNQFLENPYYSNERHLPKALHTVMINAVGFGGNAVSIILSKP